MEDYRAQFIDIYNKNVTRPGADRLLKWLEGTDFFYRARFHQVPRCMRVRPCDAQHQCVQRHDAALFHGRGR